MRLFITGISGLLGLNMALEARNRCEVFGCYRRHPVVAARVRAHEADVRVFDTVERLLKRTAPDVVVHTVGMSNVDTCEVDPGLAQELNVDAAREVARAARTLGARLVHISTDHLFDGEGPWRAETDSLAPLNLYAKTKGEAEQIVLNSHPQALVIRTNFYGWGTSVRTSFSDWILSGLERQTELRMFTDVYFTPILVNDLVEIIFELLTLRVSGLFHVAGGERLSKYDFAMRMAEVFGYSAIRIRPVSVEAAQLRARRPRDMSLTSAKVEAVIGRSMPSAVEGLRKLKGLQERGWALELQRGINSGRVGSEPR